jgi:hypothetical protein
MKPLLLLFICCVATFAVQAQTESTDLQKLKADAYNLPLFKDKARVFPNNNDSLTSSISGQPLLKSAKPGIYRLPQDGMPCIVPDTKDIAAIPNTFKGRIGVPFTGNRPRIPNAKQPGTLDLPGKK